MRNFDAKKYVTAKVAVINEFFRDNGLDSAVIGISGGIDSAVSLLLLYTASFERDSPIKKIRAIKMPINGNGTTGQSETVDRGNLLSKRAIGVEWKHCDLTCAYEEMVAQMHPDEPNAWTNGQMASVLRTPMLYYQAAMLQQLGFRSIVVGTTNRDEGSYIGFFGKASDAMVDLQPIADIHKSEVYKVAEILGVPQEIIDVDPKGDVHDGRNDEQMIGAPYWFLQEFIEAKCQDGFEDWVKFGHELYKITPETHQMYIDNIEKIHNTNKHKYMVGSPARFIDVMDRCVPGGWQSIENIVEDYRKFAWKNGCTLSDKLKWLSDNGHTHIKSATIIMNPSWGKTLELFQSRGRIKISRESAETFKGILAAAGLQYESGPATERNIDLFVLKQKPVEQE